MDDGDGKKTSKEQHPVFIIIMITERCRPTAAAANMDTEKSIACSISTPRSVFLQ